MNYLAFFLIGFVVGGTLVRHFWDKLLDERKELLDESIANCKKALELLEKQRALIDLLLSRPKRIEGDEWKDN